MKLVPLFEASKKKYTLTVFMDDWKQEDKILGRVGRFLSKNKGFDSYVVNTGSDDIWIAVTNFKDIDEEKLEEQIEHITGDINFDSQSEFDSIVQAQIDSWESDQAEGDKLFIAARKKFSEADIDKAIPHVIPDRKKWNYEKSRKETGIKSGISMHTYTCWYLLNKYDSDKELQKLIKPKK